MKKYEPPQIELIKFNSEDFITTSGELYQENNHGYGNAWGYNNGQHNGHGKGHNPHDN